MIITISGLPRSGTAFLGNFLAQRKDAIAFHELAAYEKDWREKLREAEKRFAYVINSCTYGHHAGGYIESEYNIWINSLASESIASMAKVSDILDEDFFYRSKRASTNWFARCYVDAGMTLSVQKKDVFSVDSLSAIWSHVYEIPIDKEKVASILRLKVTHDIDQLMDFENRTYDKEVGRI